MQNSSRAKTISIVIVNWNSGTQLRECLASIHDARLPQQCTLASVVVVDNASSDQSAQGIDVFGLPLRLIVNATNRGFAAACNQGARADTADLILFLNPDTRLFADSLLQPLDYLAEPAHTHVGILGIQLLDDSGTVTRCCARFPRARHFLAQSLGLDRFWPSLGHLMLEWDHLSTRTVDQVIGAFFLTRRSLFDSLGGFDERFFVYFEEVDYALRARAQGSSCVHLASARAYHAGGGTSRQIKGRRLFYSLQSRLQYGRKHYGPLEVLALCVTSWLIEPCARAGHLLLAGRRNELPFLWEAYRLLLSHTFGRASASR